METGFFGTCHAPRCFIRQFDGKYPVNGIANSRYSFHMDADQPAKLASYLPTKSAKAALVGSIALATAMPSALLWLQVDTLLSPAIATRLSILLPSAALLLIGSYLSLYFVVRAYNKKAISITITELHGEDKKP